VYALEVTIHARTHTHYVEVHVQGYVLYTNCMGAKTYMHTCP